MQTENRFFDDFARMAGGAFNALGAIKTEVENQMRQQFETFVARMKMVTREEFDAAQAMLAKAREEQEALAARVAALEAKIGTEGESGEHRRTRKRPPSGES